MATFVDLAPKKSVPPPKKEKKKQVSNVQSPDMTFHYSIGWFIEIHTLASQISCKNWEGRHQSPYIRQIKSTRVNWSLFMMKNLLDLYSRTLNPKPYSPRFRTGVMLFRVSCGSLGKRESLSWAF